MSLVYRPNLTVGGIPNSERVKQGLALLGIHARIGDPNHKYPETVIQDAIADILHVAVAVGLSPTQVSNAAVKYCLEENKLGCHEGNAPEARVIGKPLKRIPGRDATTRLIAELTLRKARTKKTSKRRSIKKP